MSKLSDFELLSYEEYVSQYYPGLEPYESRRVLYEMLKNQQAVYPNVRVTVARNKGLIVDSTGNGAFLSYPTDWYEPEYEDGVIYLHENGTVWRVRVWDGEFLCIDQLVGVRNMRGINIGFKGEYPSIDRPVSVSKHAIMLALFKEGGAVLQAIGRRGRRARICRLDGNKLNRSPRNLSLIVSAKYRVVDHWYLNELWIGY